MDFSYSARTEALRQRLLVFMDEVIYPNERVYTEQLDAATNRWESPPIMEELKRAARAAGLWNLFLPDSELGAGLTTLEYAPLCEILGRSPIAPEACNCSAPDTGNMEVLVRYGTKSQKRQWLTPLLEGTIRSAYTMTEPEVASSDATNMAATAVLDGDEVVINGRKWWSSGVGDPRCKIGIFMGLSVPDASRHAQHSMVLVPMDTPGVEIKRMLPGFGEYDEPHGRERVADARIAIDQARLLTLFAAWKIDKVGAIPAMTEISAIKVVAPNVLQQVCDWAIQLHGGMGVSRDVPLTAFFAQARSLRLADGPDEVHKGVIARIELAKAGLGK